MNLNLFIFAWSLQKSAIEKKQSSKF